MSGEQQHNRVGDQSVNSTSVSLNSTSPDSVMELQLSDLTIRAGEKTLLNEVSETISAGKITVIVGPSGAGKSVLLRTLAGLIPKNSGSLQWEGDIFLNGSEKQNLPAPGNVGVVFQQYALFDELSSEANVQFAIDHRSNLDSPPSLTAKQWLSELGVPERVAVGHLSGGQKQRLAIARTLSASPRVIFYDEPTSGLDAASGNRVAELIRETHRSHQRTSVIVTHDYGTLLPIADDVLLFDARAKTLERIPSEQWAVVHEKMRSCSSPTKTPNPSAVDSVKDRCDQFLIKTGSVLLATARLPLDSVPRFPRWKWGFRFTGHYLNLIAGPSAWVYLMIAGLIIGFTSTYFTFRFLPFRLYTQPLLIDELLSSVGFALYRILVPILATILIAARCGAAVTADVGVKTYGGQSDAMKTLGLQPTTYMLTPIVIAFIIATPLLEWIALNVAELTSLVTFLSSHPEMGPHFWSQHFHSRLSVSTPTSFMQLGWQWVLLKNMLCGIGTAAIGYHQGIQPKASANDVSKSITSTVLWATLYVLAIHFTVALIEF